MSEYNELNRDTEYDVVIIGAGPAGLAATTYALRAHLHVALVAPEMGGKVSYRFALRGQAPVDTVWGAELVRQFETYIGKHLDDHYPSNVTQITTRPGGDFELTLDGTTESAQPQRIGAKTVIVSTGASPQRLFVPGEEEYWGSGVSFSAISHATLFRGRSVAVVGYGERALLAVLQLAGLAEHVYFIPTSALDFTNPQVKQMRELPAISVLEDWELLRIEGDEYVHSIKISKGYDMQTLKVEGVFIEMGLLPNKDFLRDIVTFDPETGRIPINQRCETGVPGLFAAGDVTDVYAEQVPVALGEGVKAALSAWEYLALQSVKQAAPA